MKKFRYLLKNVGIFTISNFASKILVVLLVPLYTNVLSTEEYGRYDLVVSTISLLYPILTFNIVDAIILFSLDKKSNKKRILSIGTKFIFLSVLFMGIGLLLVGRINHTLYDNHLSIYMFFYYVAYSLYQYIYQSAKGLEKVKAMGIAGVVSTFLTILANLFFLLVVKWGIDGFFLANILAQVVSAFILACAIKMWKYIDFKCIDYSLQKEMLIYSVPLITTAIGWWINGAADKFIVAFMLGVSANGLLAVAYKIPQIINTMQGIFIQAWQISAIKEYGEIDSKEFYGLIFLVTNFLMSIACSILIICTRLIAGVLFAKDFYAAWSYVPFLLVSSVINCASGLIGPILAAQKNTKAMMRSAVFGSCANIIMNLVLVKIIGIQGATIATVICSFLIYQIRKSAVRTDLKIENYSIVLVSWGLLCAQAIIEIYLGLYLFEALVVVLLIGINIKTLRKIVLLISGLFQKE